VRWRRLRNPGAAPSPADIAKVERLIARQMGRLEEIGNAVSSSR